MGTSDLFVKLALVKPFKVLGAKYHKYIPVVLFLAGILYDILTLQRIDHWPNIVQQAIFLLLIGIILTLETLEIYGTFSCPKLLAPLWRFREFLVHFFFGALLSANTLFYFKSSASFPSFLFLSLLALMLVANELPRFQRFGLPVRFILYSLCLTSYFAYLFPIFLGVIGPLPFSVAIVASLCVFTFIVRMLVGRQVNLKFILRKVAAPALGIQLLFGGLYFFHMIPPVPLSTEYIGIYHGVKKVEGKYSLAYTRPAWKFWQNGDQTYLARPGDRLFCFAQIFSPTAFSHQVNIRWLHKTPRRGWQTWDVIPVKVVGGRDEGFRAYTHKGNYTPGRWRVQIETEDGREIGRIYFTIILDTSTEERVFRVEKA